MNWTIAYNGVEKSLADWGLSQVTRKLVSQGADELTFRANGAPADSVPLFAKKTTLTLYRNRIGSGTTWSGGTPWFSGLVIQVPRAGSPDSENLSYKIAGPWWYLDNLVFQQPYQNIFLGFAVVGDPTTAIYGVANSSHLFLNQAPVAGALQKITTGQQIIEALNWALKPFIASGVTPPFQIGVIAPVVDVPIDEVRDITCAEVIHKMLRWTPDAVAWFDYTTSPPTFNCKQRPQLTSVSLDLSQGDLVKDISVNARYDLQKSSVQIFYETSSSVNGSSSLSLATDFYPNPLPTDAPSQFNSLQFTVDLQGIQATNSTATLTCESINPTDPAWWQARHPEYTPYDPTNPADANNTVSSFSIDATTIQRAANPAAAADKGYANELTTGQIAPWMSAKSQRITITAKGTVTHRNGDIKPVTVTHQCVATNATSGTYANQQVSAFPEPVPFGLAQFLYNAISPLQFEGSLTLQEQDCSGALSIGNVFNLIGGSLTEWTTMNAMVQEVSENLDAGATTIQFGPPRNLSAGELVDILRVNRLRLIKSAYSMRAAGTPSDSSADLSLGQNTPEKNFVSGVAPPNPAVVSSTPDGSGPIITHLSSALDCSTVWIGDSQTLGAPPAGGQVKIALSDAAGQQLKIQPVQLCLNGVAGSMYFLCSNFIPNS